MIVLGVESSCDETGIALYDTDRGLLAHALHSQVAMHEEYGGVVPELASRDHIRRAIPLLEQVLTDSALPLSAIDAIAYTQQCVSRPSLADQQHRYLAVGQYFGRNRPHHQVDQRAMTM